MAETMVLKLIEAHNQKVNICKGCIFNGYRGCGLAVKLKLQCFENEKHFIWVVDEGIVCE